jgi:hypothetical protein
VERVDVPRAKDDDERGPSGTHYADWTVGGGSK